MEKTARFACLGSQGVEPEHFQRRRVERNHFVAPQEYPHKCPDLPISMVEVILDFLSQVLYQLDETSGLFASDSHSDVVVSHLNPFEDFSRRIIFLIESL